MRKCTILYLICFKDGKLRLDESTKHSGQYYSSKPTLSKLIPWKKCWRCSLKTKKSEGENLMYLRTKAAINLPFLKFDAGAKSQQTTG